MGFIGTEKHFHKQHDRSHFGFQGKGALCETAWTWRKKLKVLTFYIHILRLFSHLHSKPSFTLSALWKSNSLTCLCVDPSIWMFMMKCILTSMWPYYSPKFELSLVRLAIHLLGKAPRGDLNICVRLQGAQALHLTPSGRNIKQNIIYVILM